MTTTNTHAAAIIDDMIARDEDSLRTTEETLMGQLAEMERRLATVREGLERGLNVESHLVRESAHKIEESISQRRAIAENLRALEHVRKAAIVE